MLKRILHFNWYFKLTNILYICPFSFGHCVVCPSSIYGFWLLLWYLQTIIIPYVIFQLL